MAEISADDNAQKTIDGLYVRVRAQIETEIQLYNQRIVWLITMQAFLFATIGLLVQSVVQDNAAPWLVRIDGLMIIVCVVGIVVALICDRLLTNARAACAAMLTFWSSRISEFSVELVQYYPSVDGGNGLNKRGFLLRSGLLPKYFAAMWIAVALVWFWRQVVEFAAYASQLIGQQLHLS